MRSSTRAGPGGLGRRAGLRPAGALAAFLAAVLAASPAWAFRSNTAGSAAQFLRIGAGARALGMGEAYGALADGAEAVYWNPAGLARLERPEVSLSHIEMQRFFRHEHLAYAHPVEFLGGTLGGSATLFHQDQLDLVSNTNQTVGQFHPRSEAYALAYARSFKVGESADDRNAAFLGSSWGLLQSHRPLREPVELWNGNLLAGVAVKHIRETLHDRRASATAIDAGVLFHQQGLDGLALGAGLRNVGSKLRFVREHESLPSEVWAGAAYQVFAQDTQRLLAAVEMVAPYYGVVFGKAGCEYSVRAWKTGVTSVRLGYSSLAAPDLSPLAGLTGGVGVRQGRLSLDLAFQPMAELGQVYRASIGYRF